MLGTVARGRLVLAPVNGPDEEMTFVLGDSQGGARIGAVDMRGIGAESVADVHTLLHERVTAGFLDPSNGVVEAW